MKLIKQPFNVIPKADLLIMSSEFAWKDRLLKQYSAKV